MLRDHETHAGHALSDAELADRIALDAAHLEAALCAWLVLVGEFDERRAWASWGCRSCAHWLGWRCSLSASTAREHVRVARRLRDLPLVRDAFARGELTYSKVRALTRLEEIADEEAVVRLGRVHTASQLDHVVRATRRVSRAEAVDAHRDRYLLLYPTADGSVEVHGRLSAEDGQVLRRALGLAREVLTEEGAAAGVNAANLAADALVRLADSVLVTGPSGRATADRHEVVVHVDADTLCADSDGGTAGIAQLDDAVPIAVQTAQRLCCDAGIVVQLERGGEPLAVGRRTRSIPPAIRRALRTRDRHCQFPGCTQTRWVDAHHLVHWAHGGRTDLSNLVLLCGHHHKLVHEHGFTVRATAATKRPRGSAPTLEFRTPHGDVLQHHPRPHRGDPGHPARANRAAGIACTPATTRPGWNGESFHPDYSVMAFLDALGPPAAPSPVQEP